MAQDGPYDLDVPKDPFIETALGPLAKESEADTVVGLLRSAAEGLTNLMREPGQPGDEHHISAALHAVHRALIELEPLAGRPDAIDGPWPLP